jgi:NADH dehydrogenase
MRLAVTGANGAAGRAILRILPSARPAPSGLVAVVRSERAAGGLRPLLVPPATVVHVSYAEPAGLEVALAGADAVIHLPGILVERPGSTYEAAHVETTRRVVEAAGRGRAGKLVLVSAVGADPSSANRYWRTKGDAEATVAASGIPYTVLRVPVLLGRGTEAAAALRRRLGRRAIVLLDGGRTLQQPLAVDDLARATLRACDPGVARNRTLELAGPVSLPDREIVERAARLTGRRVRIIPVPSPPVRLALAVWRRLGAGGPSPDVLEVITTDTRLDPAPAARELGVTLTGLDEMLRESLER